MKCYEINKKQRIQNKCMYIGLISKIISFIEISYLVVADLMSLCISLEIKCVADFDNLYLCLNSSSDKLE